MEECRRFLFCFIFLTSLESIQMLSHYHFDFFFLNPLHKLNSYGISLSLPPSLTNRQNVLCLSFTDANCAVFTLDNVRLMLPLLTLCQSQSGHAGVLFIWRIVWRVYFDHVWPLILDIVLHAHFWTCTTPHFSIIRRCDTLSSAGV